MDYGIWLMEIWLFLNLMDWWMIDGLRYLIDGWLYLINGWLMDDGIWLMNDWLMMVLDDGIGWWYLMMVFDDEIWLDGIIWNYIDGCLLF